MTTGSTSIDQMNPKTPEEFDQLLEALKNKFHRLEVRICLPLLYHISLFLGISTLR